MARRAPASEAEKVSEALHRVVAARNNVVAVLGGAWEWGATRDEVLQGTVALLDQAAEWLEGRR